MKIFPDDIDYCERLTPKQSQKILRLLRICAVVGQTFLVIETIKIMNPLYMLLCYYSQWGVVMSWIAFIFLLISSFVPNETNGQKLFHKISYLIFECTWTSQSVITIFFWGVLFWMVTNVIFSSGVGVSLYFIESHSFAMLMLIFDFLINKVVFHVPHFLFVMIPPIVYMILGITLSYTANFVAYEILTWKDIMSIIIAVVLVGLFVGSFYIGHLIGKKNKPSIPDKTAGLLTQANP